MEIFWSELIAGLPTVQDSERILIRLVASMFLGGIVGLQRERVGKAAGMRTHILISISTALFVLVCTSVDMGLDGLSRVIQGIATGLGFIGTGTILKRSDKMEVHGLTTAAGLFLTAAIGVACGIGRIGLGIVAAAMAWLVLSVLAHLEIYLNTKDEPDLTAEENKG